MDIKAVSKNLMEKGPKETYRIYKKRKQQEEQEVILAEISKLKRKQELNITMLNEKIAFQDQIIGSLLNERESRFVKIEYEIFELLKIAHEPDITQTEKKIIQQVIREKEMTKGYRRYLKRKYIKRVLPEVYKTYAVLPVEDKMVFMQPRKGLNQSCKYMYHYIEKHRDYKLELHELKRGEVPATVYYLNAVEWIRSMATAKACFVHESNNLMGYVDIRPETKIVQLWHGCGILKKIGLSTADMDNFKSMKVYEEYPEYNKYDIVTTASPEVTWIFEEFMGIDRSEGVIQPIGVSRTDEFFDQEYIERCYKKIHEKVAASRDKKIILYAPTYRGVGNSRKAPDKLDFKMFADKLGDDYILIIKHHQTVKNLPPIPEEYKDKFAYDMTRGCGMDINELMTVSDICISDYSSLIFEFALFERPIMFYVYDLEDYIDERGLYYNFDETSPGPICRTNEEMVDYILHIDEKFNKQEVIDFKYKFMRSCDGHATERILDYIESIDCE